MDHIVSGRIARGLEPFHAMTYFAPETEQYLAAAGLKPGRMCYFAGRGAPMGAVSASVVAATFYNFNPDMVARHIPAAWSLATPSALVDARFAAVDAALRRLLGDELIASPELAEAAELARRVAQLCCCEGRPLAAAHLELDWPEQSHLVLWHAISILREHRGDGHLAALLDADLNGLQALITHTATGKGFLPSFAKASRGWSDEQWDAEADVLRERGVLDSGDEPALTEVGEALRQRIEGETDRLGGGPWSALGEDEAVRLGELVRPLVRTLLKAGCFPSEGVFTPRG
ncbi:SCO6745 family protein [Pseudonocardia spinosispora]|uniref:SCO6745 family protein n=1 Tax=Pseudonocardia spinosispora TaxID=103441 RepID=UPI003CCC0E25